MKLKWLCFGFASLSVISHVTASITGCGTEQLYNDISTNMEDAAYMLGNLYRAVDFSCLATRAPCFYLNSTEAIANLTRAADLFNLTISNYTAYLNGTFTINCNIVAPTCSCRFMKGALEFILASYNQTYAPKWNDFSSSSHTATECSALATSLRDLVESYFCATMDLISAFELCGDVCKPCADQEFIDYVSNNVDDAFQLIQVVNNSLVDYCSDPQEPLDPSIGDAVIANLTLAKGLLDITIVNYTEYLNDTFVPPLCYLPGDVCDCENIAISLDAISQEIAGYYLDWDRFINYDPNCNLLARKLRLHISDIACQVNRLNVTINGCVNPQVGCGTEMLRTDIESNMTNATGIIRAFNETIYEICPAGDQLPCVDNIEGIIANLTLALNLFNLTYSNYSDYLGQDPTISCTSVPLSWNCSDIMDTASEVLATYGRYIKTYRFFSTMPDQDFCYFYADLLREDVSIMYCKTLTLLQSLESRSVVCEPCGSEAFYDYVSTNMNTAFDLVAFVSDGINEYCSTPVSPIDCDFAAAAIANLTIAEQLFLITIANYTQYLNDTYVPSECLLPGQGCDCDAINRLFNETETDVKDYETLWFDFSTAGVRKVPCNILAFDLRKFVESLKCDVAGLKFLIQACPCPCVGPDFSGIVTQNMKEAMSLIEAVMADNPVPCLNRTSFCTGIDLNLILSNLQAASNLFAQTYGNFSTVPGGSQDAISCLVLQPECNCRLINGLLKSLNISYHEDFLPVWTNYTAAPAVDCQAKAAYLQELVRHYYCITQDLYGDYGQCQVLCNRDWCAFYNCSSCPPDPRCCLPRATREVMACQLERAARAILRPFNPFL